MTQTQTDTQTCAHNGHTAAGQGVCLWSSCSGSPAAAAVWVCQVSVRGACMGLNDGRMGGGRDGSRLMCRQRRSLLCVSEAHKAASVCAGTEGPPFTGHSFFFFFAMFSVAFLSCCLWHLSLLPRRARRIQKPSAWRCNLV